MAEESAVISGVWQFSLYTSVNLLSIYFLFKVGLHNLFVLVFGATHTHTHTQGISVNFIQYRTLIKQLCNITFVVVNKNA